MATVLSLLALVAFVIGILIPGLLANTSASLLAGKTVLGKDRLFALFLLLAGTGIAILFFWSCVELFSLANNWHRSIASNFGIACVVSLCFMAAMTLFGIVKPIV